MSKSGRTSIFAERMKKQREGKLKSGNNETEKKTDISDRVFGDKSYVVSGSEASVIHQENVEKLSSMTSEEIERERNILLKELDPSVIEFLKRRRIDVHEKEAPPVVPTSMDTSEPKFETDVEEKEDVKEFVNRYPHMDVVEQDKLQWIGELKKPEPPPPDKPYNARFDFDGMLLAYSDEGAGVLKGLHNHGEEQERPGYTLQELIQLTRSSVLKQRIIALNTLAKVLANASSYEKYFDKPLLPALLDADIYLLLRFSLDDPTQPVVMASALTLCNLIVNHTDETCLDLLLGTPLGLQQPSLGVTIEMKPSEIEELKDHELLKLDIVKGAIRTEILPRIRYVLEMLEPEPVETKHLVKTATRLARHSYEATESVFMCPGLLNVVRALLDVKSSSYFPEALKMFRVISCRSRSLAQNILEKCDILTPIFRIISGERAQGHPELLHLTLEAFYTWQTFLSYNLATDTIGSLTPVLMRLLEVHFGLTSLSSSGSDLEHATALLSILISAAKINLGLIQHVLPLALRAATKWTTQLISSQSINLPAAKIVGAALQLMALSHSEFDTGNDLAGVIGKFLRSSCFCFMAQRLRKFSWLLSGELGSSPENLPCLGSIPPTLHFESVFPLFHGLASFILATKNKVLAKLFINNIDILGFIEDILKNGNLNKLCSHWYGRQELAFLVTLVHISTEQKEGGIQDIFQKLSFLLVTLVQAGDKYLLPVIVSKAIFNVAYFRNNEAAITEKLKELNMENSEVSNSWFSRRAYFNQALEDFDKIEACYMLELGLSNLRSPPVPITLTGLLNSTQPALPSDWAFLPILRVYNTQGIGKDSVEVATRSLQWILLLEESNLGTNTNVTAKYCRLSCLFLAGNDLFRDINPLLECTLQSLLRSSAEINFEQPIPGLTSFYDFYQLLLEQYAGVSYCDPIFGAFVLVAQQQRHSPRYKKLLWTEHGTILRLLSTPVEKVNLKDHLEPCETDGDLLTIYLYSIASGKVREIWSPVLYKMAVHHVATYVRENDTPVATALKDRINKLGNKQVKDMLLNYSGPE